jgi:hypothetical protein
VNERPDTENDAGMGGPEQQPGGVSEELRPYVNQGESEELNGVEEWLLTRRPVPSAGFRAELHGRLSALVDRERRWRPRRLRLVAIAYTGCGLGLMAVAAIGLAGAGPLGS